MLIDHIRRYGVATPLPPRISYSCLQEYMNNIRIVDNIVRETEKLFETFYRDQDTAYIFTSDHGMSEIGNHGDGRELLQIPDIQASTTHIQIQITPEHLYSPGEVVFEVRFLTRRTPHMTTIPNPGVFLTCIDVTLNKPI